MSTEDTGSTSKDNGLSDRDTSETSPSEEETPPEELLMLEDRKSTLPSEESTLSTGKPSEETFSDLVSDGTLLERISGLTTEECISDTEETTSTESDGPGTTDTGMSSDLSGAESREKENKRLSERPSEEETSLDKEPMPEEDKLLLPSEEDTESTGL